MATSEIFKNAHKSFLDSLGPVTQAQYSPCASGKEFQEKLKELEGTTSDTGTRLRRPLRGVYSLTKFLEQYFAVVDIFVSSNPEFAALFWGAFRLVLQLASQLVSFFEKLVALIDTLLDSFPRYEEIVKLCTDENSSRIRGNIEAVYVDFFEIFQAAVQVFTKSDGARKGTARIVGGLIWRPFDARFKDMVDRMEINKYNVAEELKVWTLKRQDQEHNVTAEWRQHASREVEDAQKERSLAEEERRLMREERLHAESDRAEGMRNISCLLAKVKEAIQSLEQHRLDHTISGIQDWLRAPNYEDARHGNTKMRDHSTATWIFEDARYLSWQRSEAVPNTQTRKFEKNMLWIYGNPGSGKTTLATSILDELDEETDHSGESFLVLYHFFQFDSSSARSPASALRSFLSQLLWQCRHIPLVVDKFAFMMSTGSKGQTEASERSLVDLLTLCLRRGTCIVVDGLDECSNPGALVSDLLRLSRSCGLRFLVLSRNHVASLQRSVKEASQLALPKAEMSLDIQTFCAHELVELVEEGILPASASDTLDELTEHLVRGADGMFLWARLMFDFLRSSSTSQRRKITIITEIKFPEGLEKMYERILAHLAQTDSITSNLARCILTWLAYRAGPMTTHQTRQACVIEGVWTLEDNVEGINEFDTMAVNACLGLVELVPLSRASSDFHVLRLVHQTVKEMLTDAVSPTSSTPHLRLGSNVVRFQVPTPETANLKLAGLCLRQLIYHTPSQPLASQIFTSLTATELAKKYPFTDYSAMHWIQHLISMQSNFHGIPLNNDYIDNEKSFSDSVIDFCVVLKDFLSKPEIKSVWLETFYTATSHDDRRPLGRDLMNWATWMFNMLQVSSLKVEDSMLSVIVSLFSVIADFQTELDLLTGVWHENLKGTPHLVWDEMTASGLASRDVFFSMGSTKASSRGPQRPEIVAHRESCAASTSATSADGKILCVLSLWPLEPPSTDRLGTWAVSYELWELRLRQSRIAWLVDRVRGPQSRSTAHNSTVQDLLHVADSNRIYKGKSSSYASRLRQATLKSFTASENTAEAHIDAIESDTLSISSDGLSFAVCSRIWRIEPHCPEAEEGKVSLDVWPEPIVFGTTDIPTVDIKHFKFDRSSVIVMTTNEFTSLPQYIMSVTSITGPGARQAAPDLATDTEDGDEDRITGKMIIRAYELKGDREHLKAKSLCSQKLDMYATGLVDLTYHPILPICAIHERRSPSSVTVWNFNTGIQKTFASHQDETGQFSECGSFIIMSMPMHSWSVKSKDSLRVIAIDPQIALSSKLENFLPNRLKRKPPTGQRSSIKQEQEPTDEPGGNFPLQQAIQQVAGRTNGLFGQSSMSMRPNGTAAAISTLTTTTGVQVQLSRPESPTLQSFQLVALPHRLGLDSKAEVQLPQTPAESVVVIVHKSTHGSDFDGQFPIVLERDPRFIHQLGVNSTGGLLSRTGSLQLEEDNTTEGPENGDSTDGEDPFTMERYTHHDDFDDFRRFR